MILRDPSDEWPVPAISSSATGCCWRRTHCTNTSHGRTAHRPLGCGCGAVSSDPQRALERASWYIDPARAYSSFQQMAEQEQKRDDGVDAVMITTPNNMHYPLQKRFGRWN